MPADQRADAVADPGVLDDGTASRAPRARTLLIVGAGFSQRRAIGAIRAEGVEVIAVDGDCDAPGFAEASIAEVVDFSDVERVVEIARRREIDGVLTVASDRAVPVVAAVAARLGLPGIGVETARVMTNKIAMRERLAAFGVPQPRFVSLSGRESLERVRELQLPVVVKAADSVGFPSSSHRMAGGSAHAPICACGGTFPLVAHSRSSLPTAKVFTRGARTDQGSGCDAPARAGRDALAADRSASGLRSRREHGWSRDASLVAQHPGLLAGAAAFDSVADFAYQYGEFPSLLCNRRCLRTWRGPVGLALQSIARHELHGSPATRPRAYAIRSPIDYARRIALSGVPLELWWSTADRVVPDQREQTAELWRQIRQINPTAPVEAYVGTWAHTAEMRSTTRLPVALADLGLLPRRVVRPGNTRHFAAAARPVRIRPAP